MGVFSRLSAEPVATDVLEAEIGKVVQRILAERNPVRIVLFGSAARGEATDASDLDFCVVVDSELDIRGASRALYRNGLFSTLPVDILWFTEVTFQEAVSVGGVGALIAREGRIVYQRDIP